MATATMTTAKTEGKATVLYDGMCPLCRASIAVLRNLDWLRQLRFQDARDTKAIPEMAEGPPLKAKRLIEEMHVVTPDRRRAYAGFEAFRYVAGRVLLLVGLVPFMYLPGIPAIGQSVYLWVAKNRFNLVPCKDGVCGIKPSGTKGE